MIVNPNNDPWFCVSCCSDISFFSPDASVTGPTNQNVVTVGSHSSPRKIAGSLTCWCFNARSIVNKKLDLFAKLSVSTPGIVMITETYLDSTIATSEIFPSNYTVYRLDRNRHGGGVLIAVLEAFNSFACPQFTRPDIELLWIQLLVTSKPIMFGVSYRPPSSPDSYLMELQHSLSLLPCTSLIFLGGDFNIPGVSPSVKGLDKSSLLLSSVMDDFFLDQCVSTPTRGSNLLDQ